MTRKKQSPQYDASYGWRNRRKDPHRFVVMHTVQEINRLIDHRHGGVVPETDDDTYQYIVAQFFMNLAEPWPPFERWCKERAPFMSEDDREACFAKVSRRQLRFRADTLGKRLGVTFGERTLLRLTRIGAKDLSREMRALVQQAIKRRREQKRSMMKRRALGAKPRDEYLASAKSKTKPWEAAGISRRTWYRRQKTAGTTCLATILSLNESGNGPVPSENDTGPNRRRAA